MTDALSIHQHGTTLHCTPQRPLTLEHSAEYEAALHDVGALLQALATPQHRVGAQLVVDMSSVVDYDSYCVVWLAALHRLAAAREIGVHIEQMDVDMQRFVHLLDKPFHAKHPRRTSQIQTPKSSSLRTYVASIGTSAMRVFSDMRFFTEFIGEFFVTIATMLAKPWRIREMARWEDVPAQLTRSGVGAVPIVAMIGFLMGLIVGYQGAVQLAQFGAEIYLADMVAISMTRELGPLMTAIIMAGRSGAAFAAEIGTMQVSEEVDALRVMGFNVMHFLVMPRVVAVMLAMPLLVLFSDFAGILGGLLIGTTVSKLSFAGYLNETQYAMTYWHLFTGLIKSVVLGGIIAVVGCMRGLQVRGGADSVGQFTTAAVVTAIVLLIVADALFTLLFQALGI
jgi:phospholipid/cholesterol/gamma-HCH transport system permease protein